MPTYIDPGVATTSFGAPEGSVGRTYIAAPTGSTNVLSSVTVPFIYNGTVAAGQTDLVLAEYVAPCALSFKSISYYAESVTDACSFMLYNLSSTRDIIGDTAITTGAEGTVTSFAAANYERCAKGSVLQLRVTTQAATGAITNLNVVGIAQMIGETDNV